MFGVCNQSRCPNCGSYVANEGLCKNCCRVKIMELNRQKRLRDMDESESLTNSSSPKKNRLLDTAYDVDLPPDLFPCTLALNKSLSSDRENGSLTDSDYDCTGSHCFNNGTPLTHPETDLTSLSPSTGFNVLGDIEDDHSISSTFDLLSCQRSSVSDLNDDTHVSDASLIDRENESGVSVTDCTVEDDRASGVLLKTASCFCVNCNRESITDDTDGHLNVVLSDVQSIDVTKMERKWMTFSVKDFGSLVTLCFECKELITNNARAERRRLKRKSPWLYIWPVYMWRLLTHSGLLQEYGSSILHIVPRNLHKYWKKSLCGKYHQWFNPQVFLMYNKVVPVVIDVTVRKKTFKDVLDRNRLGELKKGCDEFLIPNVLCPWGCSGYLHDSGHVSYDAIINRFFPIVEFAGSVLTVNEKACVQSSRSDFLATDINMHLYNSNWTVHPSIEFIPFVGPVVLTCDSHQGGTRKKYFHLPKSRSLLPSLYPDVLSHAVLNAKVMHRTKAHKYSTTFQMNKCSGNYSGIECTYVSENRHFDFTSHLTDINEALSYAGRMDIRGLVTRMRSQNLIPQALADSFGERAKDLFNDEQSLLNLASGATMITLDDSLKLQRMLSNHPVCTIMVDSDSKSKLLSLNHRVQKTVKLQWPSYLIRIHNNDSYGAKPNSIPAMVSRGKGNDYRILWVLCQLLLNVPIFWEIASKSLTSTSDWHGYVLAYLSKHVLGQTQCDKQFGGNPFDIPANDPRNKPVGLMNAIKEFCIRNGDQDYSFYDFDFCPSDFVLLFRREIEKGTINAVPFDSQMTTLSIEELVKEENTKSKDALVLYRSKMHPFSRIVLPEEVLLDDGTAFELRFLVTSNSTVRSNQKSSWKTYMWSRHGCKVFNGWWKTERSPSKSPVQQCDLSLVVWRELDIAVFVRRKSISLDNYRSEYLRYIGGQNKVFCKNHDIPLIISTGSGSAKLLHGCCVGNDSCKSKPEYECPILHCCSCICKECYKAIPCEDKFEVDPSQVSVSTTDCTRTNFEDSISESVSVDSFCTSVSEVNYIETQADDLNDDGSIEDDSTVDSCNCFDFTNLPTGSQCTGFGTGEFAPECDSVNDENHESLIPTTLQSELENAIEGGIGVIGTSVLLNKCGTILVRRDTQLQATRRERSVIERIASRRDVGTIPLLYLEGILFPSIFWCLSHSSDGGILGSVPTSLFCQSSTRKRFGIASQSDHAKVRLKSVGNTASTDPRFLTFTFDSIANGALEGSDTRVVLSRGFEESMGPAGMRMRNKNDNLYSDTIDNRQCVHDLCGSQREDEFDVFVTLTCNQREHFGIRNIKRYIDDGEALRNYKTYFVDTFPNEKCLSRASEIEIQKALQEASMTLTVRNWMEIRKILIRYILESEELPLGSVVRKLFVRDEYQGDKGNLAHLHMIAALAKKYSTEEGKQAIESVVRGFVDEIVGVDEVPRYISEGLLDNWSDYYNMKSQARDFLAHHCSERCMRRTGPGDKDLVCRVPDARLISSDITKFCEVSIDTIHSHNSIKVMERLGLCGNVVENNGVFIPNREYLRSKRIYAPVRHGEGNITPVVGRLFAATRSTMNIQICTSNGTSRYVVKYLIKIDENNYIAFGANQRNSETPIKADRVFVSNTKVTTSAVNEQKKFDLSRHKNKHKGRAIASTEMIQLILGYPQVHSNMEFVRVPTVPLGERPGIERESPKDVFDSFTNKEGIDAFSVMVPMVMARERLFRGRTTYRKHTPSQVAMLRDQMLSKVTLDRVFLFGIRPPELLFVDRLEWYYRIFQRVRIDPKKNSVPLTQMLSSNLNNSPLIDGLGYRIYLRPAGIHLLKEILETNPNRFMEPIGYSKISSLFRKVIKYHEAVGITTTTCASSIQLSRSSLSEWKILQDTFISTSDPEKALPIVVYSNVRPCNACKFVIHLLLSLGHFVTERDLWSHPSMQYAFASASLIPSPEDVSQDHVDDLLRLWIDDQLRYYPVGAKTIDDYIVAADNILRSVLLEDTIPINEMPPVMYTSLLRHTDNKIEKHFEDCKSNLVDATLKAISGPYSSQSNLFPERDALMKATKAEPVSWNPLLPKTLLQSHDSYSEQITIQKQVMERIDMYCIATCKSTKNILIAGPPGVGKTHCLSHGILYAMSRGLITMTTAMLADRAFMLGGKHLHKLFTLRVRERGAPHRLAELAIISLQKKPEAFCFLQRLDVLFIDECGQISAELLSVLDIIMRKIRDSSLFMGGLLLIGTIDQVQLRPINGLPFLLSPYILTMFSVVILKEYVRCAKCKVLQEMNELARSFPTTQAELNQITSRLKFLLAKHCTFVRDWEDPTVTDDVLRIFPRRGETSRAVHMFLKDKKESILSSNGNYYTIASEDTMVAMESHTNWKTATRPVTQFLNTKVKEPEVLAFYKNALYQFTHNAPGKFNATQLGLLTDVPCFDTLEAFGEIPILVAPAGTKTIDLLDPPTESTPGWKLTTVGVAPQHTINMWNHGIKAVRKQYGLKHHIASTIHSAIGHTVSKVATELRPGRELWEKAMVVVLISRVTKAKDLIFVGDKDENINAIIKGLSIRNQYDEYMNHIVHVLTQNTYRSVPSAVNLGKHPFRQKDIPIPDDTSGLVYLIVSVNCPSSMYIGFTQDMNKRIKQHNSGIGAKASSDPAKRPWGLFAYVTGFQSDRSLMRRFELQWQSIIARFKPDSPFTAASLAQQIIARYQTSNSYHFTLITMSD